MSSARSIRRSHNYKTKTKGAQEAHEAIRPSYIERQAIEGTPAEKRLYDLIWKRTVASQMVSAELDRTTIDDRDRRPPRTVRRHGRGGAFRRFPAALFGVDRRGAGRRTAKGCCRNSLRRRRACSIRPLRPRSVSRMPPARYNEASLVKRLEELGIGRPSTYAPTITTIINRGYVVKQSKEGQKRTYEQLTLAGGSVSAKTLSESFGKEKNRLQPTDIGMLVNDYLEQQFAPIIDYNFTANVEKEFDRVAEGDITWDKMIAAFYGPFHRMVDTAIETQSDKHGQARVLGADPKTGRTVKARIGRYGPMVEIEGEGEEKTPFRLA
ncbi:DNA topoisomerase [Alistipes communis]|uniref:DNA topoisomerase n=1 Tax=Alistipes communis TaxID=2585118 RepID=UPI00351FF387